MSDKDCIYLDYAATTPVDPEAAAEMCKCLTREGVFANPSSLHGPGRAAGRVVEAARGDLDRRSLGERQRRQRGFAHEIAGKRRVSGTRQPRVTGHAEIRESTNEELGPFVALLVEAQHRFARLA